MQQLFMPKMRERCATCQAEPFLKNVSWITMAVRRGRGTADVDSDFTKVCSSKWSGRLCFCLDKRLRSQSLGADCCLLGLLDLWSSSSDGWIRGNAVRRS